MHNIHFPTHIQVIYLRWTFKMDKTISSQLKIDMRGDEEQEVKCQEVMELFLAAGYFRARIKVNLLRSTSLTRLVG